MFGAAVTHLFPGLDVSPGAFAVVAMAATFGAATRATFTAMVFVFELTRDYDVILPLMLATVIADLVAGALMRDSIMTEKLTRRGSRVHTDYEVDPFRTVPISDDHDDACRRRCPRARRSAMRVPGSREAATARIRSSTVTNDASASSPATISSSWTTMPTGSRSSSTRSEDVVSVQPDDLAVTALQRMLEEEVEHLPVLEAGRLVGMCTRTDLLRIRAKQFELEEHQVGWRLLPFKRRMAG